MRIKHIVVAALYLVVGVPLILIIWSKAAALLSARSDASVLMGCALIVATLAFLCLSAYLLWRKFFDEGAGGPSDKGRHALNRPVSQRRLFPKSVNPVENFDEETINQKERSSHDRRQN